MTDSNVQPIEIGSNKQLFIDQRFIESSTGVKLSMNPPVKAVGANLRWFRRHALRMAPGSTVPWIGASGVEGLRRLTVCMNVKTVKTEQEYESRGRKRRRTVVQLARADGEAPARRMTVPGSSRK